MLVIRLFRTGKKNQPFFRIVVTDKRNAPRGGRFLEVVGFFNPLTKEKQLKAERIKYWLSKGAQPSDTVYNLFVKEGIVKGKKIAKHGKPKKEAEKPAKTLVSPAAQPAPTASATPAAEETPAAPVSPMADETKPVQ